MYSHYVFPVQVSNTHSRIDRLIHQFFLFLIQHAIHQLYWEWSVGGFPFFLLYFVIIHQLFNSFSSPVSILSPGYFFSSPQLDRLNNCNYVRDLVNRSHVYALNFANCRTWLLLMSSLWFCSNRKIIIVIIIVVREARFHIRPATQIRQY